MGPNERALAPGRVRAARAVAIAADLLQIVVFPAFLPGAASVFEDVLDAVVALLMFLLVGWHWAFLPTFLAELIPAFDLVPTWTAAVFFATRGQKGRREAQAGAIDARVVSSATVGQGSGGRNPTP